MVVVESIVGAVVVVAPSGVAVLVFPVKIRSSCHCLIRPAASCSPPHPKVPSQSRLFSLDCAMYLCVE
jgi:hypothetical protein